MSRDDSSFSEFQDIFAKIAGNQIDSRSEALFEPLPSALPDIILPLDRKISKFVFKPAPKITTQRQLLKELHRYRKIYYPFLKNLAPKAKSTRKTLQIGYFDWRVETEDDQKNFQEVLDGGGYWKKIKIPHYGPPLGKASTYYRTKFNLTDSILQKGCLFVCFQGVDYKAHVYVNKQYIGSHEGFFAPFEFDISSVVHLGENSLLVKVENDAICMGNASWGSDGHLYEGDKLYAATGPGWDEPQVGWHHCPPGMGIYQPVFIQARAKMFIDDIFVRPLLEKSAAEVWIEVYSTYRLHQPLSISLSIYGQNFKKKVVVNQSCACKEAGPGVNYYRFVVPIPSPRVWDLTHPWLYQIHVSVLDKNNQILDTQARQFGMRSFKMDIEGVPRGDFYLNGRKIRLRGANTMGFEQQCVMKKNFKRLIDDILLAKICHMNFWRLTQRPVQREIYNLCDRLGLMTQTDLPLFGVLRRNQFCEAVRQAAEMEKLVRNHPCNILVSYINEPFPNAWDKPHRHLLRNELEAFFEAADKAIYLMNPDRVIKPVEGDYEPPAPGLPDNHCYCGWYNGHGVDLGKLHKGYWQKIKPGWRYACGEFGAEGLDYWNVMKRFYPKDWLPQSKKEEPTWTPNRIIQAQTGRYFYCWFDQQNTVKSWIQASQKHQAWITRLMTEAFRRNENMVSFAIHLFIDAFPAGWMKAIMDCRRQAKPAYFVYRDALTPLMVSLRTDRDKFFSRETVQIEIWICNDLPFIPNNLHLHYHLENLDGHVLYANRIKPKIQATNSVFQGFITFIAPLVKERTRYILRAGLVDNTGKSLFDAMQEIEIFPNITQPIFRETALVLGHRGSKAELLAKELGLKKDLSICKDFYKLILCDSFEQYVTQQGIIDQFIDKGATAIFLELPAGEYRIAGSCVKVEPCTMNPRHFVSRKTGHPMVAEFYAEDFKFWFDPVAGYITPLLETCFLADEFEPILISGNGGWETDWYTTLAVGQKKFGGGIIRISQIKLSNRIGFNPTAMLFTLRLIS